jgi:hypothetical protein
MSNRIPIEEIIDKMSAYNSLVPNANVYGYHNNPTWDESNTDTKPTDAEIDAEVTRLRNQYTANEYQRTRKAKYDLLNQDEMRYDDVKNSTTTWVDAIDAIKAAHPKP